MSITFSPSISIVLASTTRTVTSASVLRLTPCSVSSPFNRQPAPASLASATAPTTRGNGTVGDHGMTILSQREGLELEGGLASDTAPLHELVAAALAAYPDIHAMRDPTRGGVAASLVEIATRRRLGVEIDETVVPIKDAVRGACEIFGL